VRCVFDTNVLVSALLNREGLPASAFRYVFTHGQVLLSSELFGEIQEVLDRPKFRRYLQPSELEEFLRALHTQAVWVKVATKVQLCRDPKDDKILELAWDGQAQYIISGDNDLLVLNPFGNIPILTVEAFGATVTELEA